MACMEALGFSNKNAVVLSMSKTENRGIHIGQSEHLLMVHIPPLVGPKVV